MNPYAGSPALAPEAREKVLQTFRHTLALAQEGKNEEALLGCDFLLKMDARFLPARGLLDMLRGVAPGTLVNVDRFSDYLGVESAGEALSESAPELPVAFPTPVPPSAVPPSAVSATSLDDLVFGDDAGGSSSAGLPEAPASVIAPRAVAPTTPGGDPFGLGLDDLRMSLPEGGPGALGTIPAPASAPPLPAPVAAAPPAPGPAAASATVAPPRVQSGVQTDPRITQFLKQGDEALTRGNAQEAIDLWSRVFLIDLSNEEASRRIDSAREAQAESARKIDLLLSEGVQSYEAGDLAGARNKFLDVLAASENDATARGYLNQIEASLATAGGSSEPLSASTGDSDFMKNEIEAPGPPSFAEDSGVKRGSHPDAEGFAPDAEGAERPSQAASRKTRVDLRILLAGGVVVLAAVAGGTYLFLRKTPPARTTNAAVTPAKGGGPGSAAPLEDTFQKAEALFNAGKIDDAIGILAKLPESDPRHNEALVRIEKMKSSAAPTPGPAPPSAAALDEMRVAGFTAMASSRYIDALKNLDPVVKARPQDAEAAAAAQRAHEQVEALRSASKSYNEYDYDSAIKLLWDLRRGDAKNQDVEEYLVNAYYNLAVQSFQAGNIPKATTAVKEATDLRPGDAEAQRLLRFARKYPKGATDLLSRILIKHLTLRP